MDKQYRIANADFEDALRLSGNQEIRLSYFIGVQYHIPEGNYYASMVLTPQQLSPALKRFEQYSSPDELSKIIALYGLTVHEYRFERLEDGALFENSESGGLTITLTDKL